MKITFKFLIRATGYLIPLLFVGSIASGAEPWLTTDAEAPATVVPQPKSMTTDGNDLVISSPVIRFVADSQNLKDRAAEIATALGFTVLTTTPTNGIDVTLTHGTDQQAAGKTNEQGEQGYTLVTGKSNGIVTVTITGGNEAGAYYGLCTLRQLIVKSGSDVVIPQTTIKDWPGIKRRGLAVSPTQPIINYISLLKLDYSLSHIGVHGDLGYYPTRYMEACALSGYKGSGLLGSTEEQIISMYVNWFNGGRRSFTAMYDDLGSTHMTVSAATTHANHATAAYEQLISLDPAIKFTFCPPQYFGTITNNPNKAYHQTIDGILPAGVDIFWSGREIFTDEITTANVMEWQTNVGNLSRKPFIFDNMPIRWAKNAPASPLKKRSADLHTVISGYMGNLNSEANWNYQNRNAETVAVTIAMYCWNPEAYNEYTAWDTARGYLERNKNLWATVNYAPVASAKSVVVHGNSAVAFPLPVSDANGEPLTITILSGPSNGTLSGTGRSRTYIPNPGFTGADSFTFNAHDGTAQSNTGTVNLSVIPANLAMTIAVNCGGGAFTAADGTQYAADTGFNSGSSAYNTTSTISGTSDQLLYQTSRWKSKARVAYTFAVPNGTYEVTLKWAEPVSAVGARTMEVVGEAERVIDLLDVAAQVGLNAAYDRTFSVEVTDHKLDILLDPADDTHNPSICAILAKEVLAAATPELKVQLAGASAVVSWPLAEQGWVLKKSDNLTTWTTVTEPVVDTPTEHTVTTPLVPPKWFFRLQK